MGTATGRDATQASQYAAELEEQGRVSKEKYDEIMEWVDRFLNRRERTSPEGVIIRGNLNLR